MKRFFAKLAFAVLTGALLVACSEDQTPEAAIRAFVASGVASAEERDGGAIMEMIHEAYIDQRGYNKKTLEGILRAYFFRHKNIHLFTRIDEIEWLDDNRALVKMHVAMAGKVISDIDAVASLRAQIYRFELGLVLQDRWQLQHADWSRASLTDLH